MGQFKEKLYRGNIRLSCEDYTQIPVGFHFPRRLMHKKTFDKLVAQGHIEEVVIGVAPKPFIKKKPIGAMTTGLENETPDAAMNPPKKGSNLGVLNELNQEYIESGKFVAPAPVVPEGAGNPDAAKVTHTAEVKADTPTVIDGLNKTQVDERVAAACAWDVDPATLKDVKLFQLVEIYTRMCAKLEVTPMQFDASDDGRDKLIAQMSCQFKSK